MQFSKYAVLGLLTLPCLAFGQYDPAAGQTGSLAVAASDARFVAWATEARIVRGLQYWEDASLGWATAGDSLAPLGQPLDGQTLSLGDGGQVTLRFNTLIYDGLGPDFAVFENGFSDYFLEVAFVEVSSDGQHFERFDAAYAGDTTQTGTFDYNRPEWFHNLAGKYRAGYGVAFDLAELRGRANLDVDRICCVRLIDVVGGLHCLDADNLDALGNRINDPYPTPFATGGFDLDAVGVFHAQTVAVSRTEGAQGRIYPNPVTKSGRFRIEGASTRLEAFDVLGRVWLLELDADGWAVLPASWPAGWYALADGRRFQVLD